MSQTAPQGQPANFHINGQNLYLLPDELIILKELIKAEGKPVTNEWLKGCIFKDYNALRQVFASLKKKLKPCPRLHIGLILARGYALTGVEVFRELPP